MLKKFSGTSLALISIVSTAALAAEPTLEQMSAEIIGDWQVISFQRRGGELADYSKDNVIWFIPCRRSNNIIMTLENQKY